MSSWSLATAVSPTVTGAVGDVIKLHNLNASSDTEIATNKKALTTTSTTTTLTSGRPTTPVPSKKLTSKRPPHLTLHIQSTSLPTSSSPSDNGAPLAVEENSALSATPSVYGTPLGSIGAVPPESNATIGDNTTSSTSHSDSTSGSIFPHEQYKTIKKIDIQFDNVRYSTRMGFFKRGKRILDSKLF